MGENDNANKGAPPAQPGLPSVEQDVITSTQPPDTYAKEEALKLVSDALADQGRKHKAELDPILQERDSLRTQVKTKDDELQNVGEERVKLQKQIDELASNDPEVFNLVKKDRELMDRERQLKTDRQVLETDKQTSQERVQSAEDTLREIALWDISAEYESGDPVRLKDLCDVFNATSEEQMRKVAETVWAKKLPQPVAPPVIVPYSGMTRGGTGFTPDPNTPGETLVEGFKRLKK